MNLSEDQRLGLDALVRHFRSGAMTGCLTGPAGSGKTTLMKKFVEVVGEQGWTVLWGAPTGKAAHRLSSVVGAPAQTVHKLTYRRVSTGSKGQPLFSDRDLRDSLFDGRRGILVVDEASMLGKRLYDHLLKVAGDLVPILFVGDSEQLEPVADKLGPDLYHPVASLETIHRQALESPIISVATEVRKGGVMPKGKIGDSYNRYRSPATEVATWINERMAANEDAIALVASNEVRRNINALCRKLRGFSDPICPGDQLVVLSNNHDMEKMNGETIRVEKCAPIPNDKGKPSGLWGIRSEGQIYYVHAPSIGEEPMKFQAAKAKLGSLRNPNAWLHVDHGYALTFHKSQGSEWKKVMLIVDDVLLWNKKRDPRGTQKMIYTGITRAKETLDVVDLG